MQDHPTPDPAEQPRCRTCGSAITGYAQLFDKDFYEPCTEAECGREKPPIFSDVPENVPPTLPPAVEPAWHDELSAIPEIQAQHEAWRDQFQYPAAEEWREQPLSPIPFRYDDFDDDGEPPADYVPHGPFHLPSEPTQSHIAGISRSNKITRAAFVQAGRDAYSQVARDDPRHPPRQEDVAAEMGFAEVKSFRNRREELGWSSWEVFVQEITSNLPADDLYGR